MPGRGKHLRERREGLAAGTHSSQGGVASPAGVGRITVPLPLPSDIGRMYEWRQDISVSVSGHPDSFLLLIGWGTDSRLEHRADISPQAATSLYLQQQQEMRGLLQSSTPDARVLAATGYRAFTKLFPEDLRAALATELRIGAQLRMEIFGRPYLLPWQLLYPWPVDESFDPAQFLGARVRIKRSIPTARRYFPCRDSVISVPQPHIQIGLHSALHHAATREVPGIESMGRGMGAPAQTSRLPAFSGAEGERFVEAQRLFNLFRSGQPNMIHLACHAETDPATGTASFTIDQEFTVESTLLFPEGAEIPSGPIVFLNACEMGVVSTDTFQNFIQSFLNSGARAVIAPECHVPDGRAADYACAVYHHLLHDRKSLSDAVHAATSDFLSRGDPIGLVYAVYGQAEARFMSPEDQTPRPNA